MFYLLELTEGKNQIVAEDEERSDLEAFADEYHRDDPTHGALSYMEAEPRPVRFRASFEDFDAEIADARKPSSGSGIRGDILAYLAKHPTVTFTAVELAEETGAERPNVSAMLFRLKQAGIVDSPERGKFQHSAKNGARKEHE